jgi:hypothetical protein
LKQFGYYGPGGETSLRQKVLGYHDARKKQSTTSSTKAYTKPYIQCTLEELKEEAAGEGLIATGREIDIIRRLERLDHGVGKFEDCTTEWIAQELSTNGFLSDGDRESLLVRVNSLDDHFNGPAQYRTSDWLKTYLKQKRRVTSGQREDLVQRADRTQTHGSLQDYDNEYLKEALQRYSLPRTGARKEWLLRLYPLEVAALNSTIDELNDKLRKKPTVVYKTSYRSSHSRTENKSSGSILGSLARGAAFGTGLSIAGRMLRRNHEKKTLTF